MVWCLDMAVEFKKAPGGFDHLLDTIDMFTKWIKAGQLLISEYITEFVQDIIQRFGVPNCIITDSTPMFIGHKFLDFYDALQIRVH
jgi:hypothetical protein